MRRVPLEQIVRYCDRQLRADLIQDYDGAVNGLQVEQRGGVARVAAAVDGTLATVRLALEAQADLLLVHHGLFWGSMTPWTGRRYELLGLLLEHDLAVYSSHLPLDAHPTLGNNAQLCAALGFQRFRPFFHDHGGEIGWQTRQRLSRTELSRRLTEVVGHEPHLLPGGSAICQRIGIVSGGAGAELKRAAEEGVDTFITGEGPHWTYALAEELGMNVFFAGHYATETFGVKALATDVSRKFKIPWVFLDHPTGL